MGADLKIYYDALINKTKGHKQIEGQGRCKSSKKVRERDREKENRVSREAGR